MAHILVIEPNQTLASTYAKALERAGHNVVTSGEAQTAVHQADEQRPDAVILEIQLPGHSGIEFLYELRSYPEWRDVPVILHTLVPPISLKFTQQMTDQLFIAAYLYKPATSLRTLVYTVGDIVKVTV